MATYPTRSSTGNHKLRNAFLKATLGATLLFGSYQFYMPDGVKDSIGQSVEHVTGSKMLGHSVSTLHPWQKPLVQVNMPAPKN